MRNIFSSLGFWARIMLSIMIISAVFVTVSFAAEEGPNNENSQLKQFYKYIFGVDNIDFSTDPKIQFNI